MYPLSFTMQQLLCEDRLLDLHDRGCARARRERSRTPTIVAAVAALSRVGEAVISPAREPAAA